jgi:hypothetical protein
MTPVVGEILLFINSTHLRVTKHTDGEEMGEHFCVKWLSLAHN